MTEFVKYMHLERLGNSEVQGILEGTCYIFPKLDGTNASVWLGDDGEVKAGSRNRKLEIGDDNAGFLHDITQDANIKRFLTANPSIRLYGEWLVPHSLKTYKEDAWRRFYVFDVVDGDDHIPYQEYVDMLTIYDVEFIPCIACVDNPIEEKLYSIRDTDNYLIQENNGVGEGIVIKNYDYINRHGRTTWAKLISSDFSTAKSEKPMKMADHVIEMDIAEKYVTTAIIDKVHAKSDLDEHLNPKTGGFHGKCIPRLLHTVYYDVIREEMWEILKEFKNPVINFKRLQGLIYKRIKELRKDLF